MAIIDFFDRGCGIDPDSDYLIFGELRTTYREAQLFTCRVANGLLSLGCQKEAKAADSLVIATDFDREGELIGLESLEVALEVNPDLELTVKRANTAAFAKDAPVHTADLRDWTAVDRIVGTEKPDAIVHLAARAGVRPSIKEPKLYIDTNITGTWHILEAARLHGVPRVVSASSSARAAAVSASRSAIAPARSPATSGGRARA